MEDRCQKHQSCPYTKDFITTFAVQLSSYREKLGEGSKKKTIKKIFVSVWEGGDGCTSKLL